MIARSEVEGQTSGPDRGGRPIGRGAVPEALYDRTGGAVCDLWHVRAEAKGSAVYWIDLEIKGDTSLRRLDEFLRRTWLECCGHMSAFEIGRQRYSVLVDRELDLGRVERSMAARISSTLTPGQRFSYEYDFGSTTHLTLKVLGIRHGTAGRAAAGLLARNEPPLWPCAVCAKPASVICPFCVNDANPFSCPEHVREHACEEEEAFLPVVNSPRMGVCGYAG